MQARRVYNIFGNFEEEDKVNRRVILNIFDDPKMSERQIVSVGDCVFASKFAEEFGLTKNNKYKILDTNGHDLIEVIKNDGKREWFTVEFFSIYEYA